MRSAATPITNQHARLCYAVALGVLALTTVALLADSTLPPPAKRPVDFARDIQPLFADRCYSCHGPDEQESGLRLDDPAHALEGGDLGPAYVPGDSAASPLVEYISGTNEHIVMPPEDADQARLTAQEVGLIRAWIDQGARWPAGAESSSTAITKAPAEEHWAFQRPVRSEPPAVKATEWPRNPIDSFVLARMEEAGLAPAPETDTATLVRRLSLDLIGLPPTPDEVQNFVNDTSPGAYERLVERLLESPHYGERWALWWLDLARYADTNGYEIDRPRSIWPYRDWVIAAFNDNLPFDQFAIEQLAGDLLPGATLSQRVATGFHRNTFTNEEGGHDWEQFRWESIVDRVHTTSTVFLGLTMACAQCHDHKYDPISQREYYEFFAFLNNDDEPHIEVPQPEITEKRDSILAQIAEFESKLEVQFPSADDDASNKATRDEKFEQWRRQAATETRSWTLLEPVSWTSKNNATLTPLDDQSLLATGDNPEHDTYEVIYHAPLGAITGLRLEALPHPSLPMHGPGRGYFKEDGTFLLSEITVTARDFAVKANDKQGILLELANPTASIASASIAQAIDGDKLTGWHIKGGAGRRHTAVFEFAEPISAHCGTELTVALLQNYAHQQTLGRFRVWITSDAAPLLATDMPTQVEGLLLKPSEQWSADERKTVKAYYLSIAPELVEEHKQLEELRRRLPVQPTTLVLQQRASRRTTHQHIRGEFSRPGPKIAADVPGFLHPLPKDAPRDRLTLARWLVDESNPLVARVIMNQVWQCYFGRGLIETPEDFGTQGAKPSHPELLDWLACRFMDEGWDLKQMHRVIVTSSLYRQAAATNPQKHSVDPENVLMSHGPRFRLPGETIRDIALTASGLLNPAIGGPSVFAPQPDGALAGVFGDAKWPSSSGPDRYRRALYTHRKRAAPYAAFAAFDAPPHHICTMHRITSNTPLQALAQLNDELLIEASQALAARVMREEPGDETARLEIAFRLCLARLPREEERLTLLPYLRAQRERLEVDKKAAAIVAGSVDQQSEKASELAAWSLVARVLLNLDETISKE
ncbi:MAG: PSD1 and planctomycete cytochrome C domain-containing protein [Pirellulales bacterium]